jgi:tetratricopeptide (TPR) repeat protein
LEGIDRLEYGVGEGRQLGQDQNARAVVDEMLQATNYSPETAGGPFGLAASPARYMVERGDWTGAAELPVRPSKFPYVVALTHFARALGAARSGHPEAAQADIAQLVELRDRLRGAKDAYWSEQVDIERQVAAAWTLHAEGKYDDALAAMSAAADAEDKTEKSPVTPGPLAPARELYGAMLLDRGNAKEALAAFEATLKKEPNRFNAFAGAAKAADKLGDKTKAAAYYEKLAALAGPDVDRPDVALAKQYVPKN